MLLATYEPNGWCVIGAICFAADVLNINGKSQKQRLEAWKVLDSREEANSRNRKLGSGAKEP